MGVSSANSRSVEPGTRLRSEFDAAEPERTLLFASTPPDAGEVRRIGLAFAVLFAGFLLLVPFARVELPRVDYFLPMYTSARIVIEALTAGLLFSLYRSLGARSILLLGCGYLFSVVMAAGHLLSFSAFRGSAGTVNDASQVTAWIHFVWHGGFSLALLGYGALRDDPPAGARSRGVREVARAAAATVAVSVLTLLFVAEGRVLPELMQGDRDGPDKMIIAALAGAFNAAAIVLLWRRRSLRSLDLWVLLVACAWFFHTGLAALFNHARFDLGWYAGRVYGLLAAGFVLIMLLVEYSRLYRRLVRHHASIRRSSVEQLQVAVTSLSVAQRAASAGVWDWDIRSGRLQWSDELFRLFGLDPATAEASFDAWRKIVHPEDLERAEFRTQQALERKVPLYNHYRVVRPGGEVRWIDAHGDVVEDESGGALRMTGLCIDVTDQVVAEEALRESEAKLRLFVEHAPLALAMLDERMVYMAVSRRWMSDYGLTDAIIGRCHYDVFPEVPERWKAVHRRALAGEVIRSEEDRFTRLDGSVQWLRWEVRPWHRANGSIGGLVAMSENISERKQAQDALRDSEYFYRQTLESIPGMVFTTRPDGYCDYQSQQWTEYTGVPASEHLGEGWNLLLHPDDRPRALAAWTAAVQGRGAYDLEYRVRRHDGAHEWFKVIGRPIRDGEGRIVRWFGVAVNIERLKQAEAQAAQRSRELEALLDAMPALVYTKDSQGRYTRVNSAACELIGLPARDIISRRDEAILPADLAHSAAESDQRVLASGASLKGVEQSWRDDSGSERWVSTSKSPFLNDDGSVAGLVGVSIEITEHKLAEAHRLQALERQRDALVREVHHRIKNHLQGVIGLLRYRSSGDAAVNARLELAITQIGSIAQVYGLQGRSQDTQLRLHELIESAIQGASMPVDFDCPPALRDIILAQADAVPMALVINELITNAIKHLEPSSAARRVGVRLSRSAHGVSVEIRGGPARLPPGFDYERRTGLGIGLELVSVLLPERRCRLAFVQSDDEVAARLTLLPEGPGGEVRAPATVPSEKA